MTYFIKISNKDYIRLKKQANELERKAISVCKDLDRIFFLNENKKVE